MIEVVDALRDLFVAATQGIRADRSAAQPIEFEDGVLYAWEEASERVSIGTGPTEYRENFEIVLVYTRDNEGEVANAERSRAVSEALDSARETWLTVIRDNEGVGPWANITASVDADMVRQLGLRGLGIRVQGYRLNGS